jgi:long-chain acyl-CoA synthetase
MKSEDPLLKAWAETLSRKEIRPAIIDPSGKIARTFREIEERARQFAADIDRVRAGEVIAVQIGNHEDWPAIFIACLRKQIVVLPLEQSISDQQRDAAMRICKASTVVFANPSGAAPQISWLRTLDATAGWDDDPPTLFKLTSGTTAEPRLIRFRSEQLLADCDQICQTMGISDLDLNFGVIPISHSYGFSNLLTPLIACGVPMVLSRDRTPRAVLVDLAGTDATVFPGTPVFYQAFCEMENVPALPKLRLCISAGAPLSVEVAKKFQEKFRLPIHSFYGASECGGICYDRVGTNEIDGFVGEPMKDVDVEIVGSAGGVSQIRVRSAAVGDGYFPEPNNEKLGNGIFVPDDLLERDNSGFKIVGRVSDAINVAGKKVNPAEVEAQLLRFAGVRQAVVFGRPAAAGALRNEEVAACVVVDVDPSTGLRTSLREKELQEFCRNALSAWQVPKRIFFVNAIPVNERGKISRRELARRFAAKGAGSASD